MKFTLSQFLFFPMPGIYLTVLALVFFRGRLRAVCLGLGMAILVILAFPAVSKFLARPLLVERTSMTEIQAAAPDVILVPTAGADQIGPLEYAANKNTLSRLAHARYLQELLPLPVILSGGDPRGFGAAESMLAVRTGYLSPNSTLLDDKAFNTAENARAFVDIMKRNGFSRPILVTQALHARRTAAALRALGVEPLQHPAWEDVAEPIEAVDFTPNRLGYRYANRVAVAYAAIAKYMLQGHFSWSDLRFGQ